MEEGRWGATRALGRQGRGAVRVGLTRRRSGTPTGRGRGRGAGPVRYVRIQSDMCVKGWRRGKRTGTHVALDSLHVSVRSPPCPCLGPTGAHVGHPARRPARRLRRGRGWAAGPGPGPGPEQFVVLLWPAAEPTTGGRGHPGAGAGQAAGQMRVGGQGRSQTGLQGGWAWRTCLRSQLQALHCLTRQQPALRASYQP